MSVEVYVCGIMCPCTRIIVVGLPFDVPQPEEVGSVGHTVAVEQITVILFVFLGTVVQSHANLERGEDTFINWLMPVAARRSYSREA
jgi:hypothetical protein